MLEESISIFKIQGMTACSIRVVICPQCCLYVLSLEHHWTYDLVRSVCRWDNPNKKTLMNIHDFVHGHSPVAPAKSQSEVREIPTTDWMHLFRIGAPTRSMIWYLQYGNRATSGAVSHAGVSRQWSYLLTGGNPTTKYVCMYSSARRFRWGKPVACLLLVGKIPSAE